MIKLCTIIIVYSMQGDASMEVISPGETYEKDCIELSHTVGDVVDDLDVKNNIYMVWGDGKTM